MNGREALKALAEGKMIYTRLSDSVARIENNEFQTKCNDGKFRQAGVHFAANLLNSNTWELYEEPATDVELISEMERLSLDCPNSYDAPAAYAHCARMLKTRKVKP